MEELVRVSLRVEGHNNLRLISYLTDSAGHVCPRASPCFLKSYDFNETYGLLYIYQSALYYDRDRDEKQKQSIHIRTLMKK